MRLFNIALNEFDQFVPNLLFRSIGSDFPGATACPTGCNYSLFAAPEPSALSLAGGGA
jgi:hypothetical protein